MCTQHNKVHCINKTTIIHSMKYKENVVLIKCLDVFFFVIENLAFHIYSVLFYILGGFYDSD